MFSGTSLTQAVMKTTTKVFFIQRGFVVIIKGAGLEKLSNGSLYVSTVSNQHAFKHFFISKTHGFQGLKFSFVLERRFIFGRLFSFCFDFLQKFLFVSYCSSQR